MTPERTPSILARLRAKFGGSSSRTKSLVAFVSSSFASRAVTIGCQLLQVPLVLHGVGTEGFGYWMTLTSISYMMNFADLGMGMGMQNKLAEAFARDEQANARRLFASTLAALGVIGLLLGVILCGAASFVDFSALFHLEMPTVQADARLAAIISLSLLCVGLPLGLAQRLAYSMQLGWWHNTAQAVAALLALAAIGAANFSGAGFLAYFLAGLLPTALVNGLLIYRLCARLNWRSWSRADLSIATVRPVLSLGAHFSVQQILNTVLYAAPPIIISTTLGAAAVTPYNLVQRLFNLFGVAQSGLMNGLWPIYSEAHARGDIAWIRKTLRRSFLATLAISVVPLAGGALFAVPIITLWVGSGSPMPAQSLIWFLFGWNASQFLQQPFWFLLAALSQIHRLTVLSLLAAVACAAGMLLLVHPFGAEGVVAGLLIGYVPLLLGGAIFTTFAYFRTTRHAPPLPGAGVAVGTSI